MHQIRVRLESRDDFLWFPWDMSSVIFLTKAYRSSALARSRCATLVVSGIV